MAQIRTRYNGRGTSMPLAGVAAGTIHPGDPGKRDAGGGVVVMAENDVTQGLGIILTEGTSGGERIGYLPFSDLLVLQIPTMTTTGTPDTAAIQTANGATLGPPAVRTPGTTYNALIGQTISLEGSTGAWYVGLDDSNATPEAFTLIGYVYNEAAGIYDAEVLFNTALRANTYVEV